METTTSVTSALMSGTVAGFAATLVSQPFDRVKVRPDAEGFAARPHARRGGVASGAAN